VVWPQNHWDGFLRFGLKTGGDSFSGLAFKPMAMVSLLSLNTVVEGFPILTSKLAATVWWFGSQNHRDGSLVVPPKQAGFGLSVAPQNQREAGRRGTRVKI
jgi:hypothetical protein